MKKRILFTMCMAAGISAFAQFTPGNLAVYRYGDGVAPLTNGGKVPVFIDEYTPAGVLVNTVPISKTANGANYGLEGLGLKADGTFEKEGYPVLSRDGSTLSIIGYNPDQAGQFVIGTINATRDVSTNTLVVDTDLGLPSGAPRSAVVEGTSVYFNSWDGGVRYKQLGTNTASTRVSTGQNAPRVLTIADTYFSASNNGVKIFAPNAGTNFPNNSLPTTSVTFATTPNIPSSSSLTNAHQGAVIKSATNRTLLYVIDDKEGGPLLRKYRSNSSGSDWVFFGSIAIPANTKSITAIYDSSTGVKVYLASLGTEGDNNSKLYSYTDNFTTATEANEPSGSGETKILPGSITEIATAPTNTTFRGVTMAPGTNVLPVSLTSFKAKEVGATVRLNWSTASEKNSSHFDVLKSFDGKDFRKIGAVNATGDSDSNTDYTFNDENPFPGVNYYQLQQFDKNGTATFYGPIQVTTAIEKTDFTIYASASKAVAEVYVYSAAKQQGKIRILNIGGQVLLEESLNLEKGFNKISLPVNGVKTGVQVAILNAQAEVITKKFLWQ